MSVRFTVQEIAQLSVLLPGSGTPERFFSNLKSIKGKGRNLRVWKFLPARRTKNVFQILQISEKSRLHTHQSSGIKCLAANIGLAAIAVFVVDGNKCFFYYFVEGF